MFLWFHCYFTPYSLSLLLSIVSTFSGVFKISILQRLCNNWTLELCYCFKMKLITLQRIDMCLIKSHLNFSRQTEIVFNCITVLAPYNPLPKSIQSLSSRDHLPYHTVIHKRFLCWSNDVPGMHRTRTWWYPEHFQSFS